MAILVMEKSCGGVNQLATKFRGSVSLVCFSLRVSLRPLVSLGSYLPNMSSMLHDVGIAGDKVINADALRSEIRSALINQKANACPIAARLAWHAAGTFDRRDNTGGCNGATIRFPPESTDPDNAGLSIVRDLLLPVKKAHPEVILLLLLLLLCLAFPIICTLRFVFFPSTPFVYSLE